MGQAAELVAAEYHVSRARRRTPSRSRAIARPRGAAAEGRFDARDPAGRRSRAPRARPRRSTRDEAVRADTSLAALGGLKPAFVDDGRHGDGRQRPAAQRRRRGAGRRVGASARRALGAEAAGAHRRRRPRAASTPKHVLMTPVDAVRRVLEKAGWPIDRSICSRSTRPSRSQLVAVLARTRARSRAGQRQRRRGGARPPDRRQRRARADHAAPRAGAARTRGAAWRRCAWAAATAWRWPSNEIGRPPRPCRIQPALLERRAGGGARAHRLVASSATHCRIRLAPVLASES